jgi:site-specific recombinase XerD
MISVWVAMRSGCVAAGVVAGIRVFKPAVQKAGLPAGTTSHDLRHHYASVLLAAGESVGCCGGAPGP